MANDVSAAVKTLTSPVAEQNPQQAEDIIAQWTGRTPLAAPEIPAAIAAPAPVLAPPVDIGQVANAIPAGMPTAPIVADYGTQPMQSIPEGSVQVAAPAPQMPILPVEALDAIAQPTQADVAAEIETLTAPIRAERAQALALDGIETMRKQAEARAAAREEDVKRQFAALDAEGRSTSLNEILSNGSFGQRLGTIIALSMGAVSQGLSGAKSNPVMDYLDKVAEQQAAKDKLTLEKKQMLKKHLYDQSILELNKLENATNSAFRKDQINMQRAQMEAQRDAATQKLLLSMSQKAQDASKWSGKALTPEQEATLTMQERRNVVNLPDGRKVLAQSYEDANQFKTIASEINNALASISELKKLGESGSKLSLKDQARANSMITKIVGALRLPYTGPGVLTDNEREALIKTLGNPLAWLSLRSVENAKLAQVEQDLMSNLQSTAKVRGINEQVIPIKFYNVNGKAVAEDALIKAYSQQMPGMSPDRIKQAIQKTLPAI